MIIRQQDEELEELGYAVDRVNDMAVGINEELKTQNQMLKVSFVSFISSIQDIGSPSLTPHSSPLTPHPSPSP